MPAQSGNNNKTKTDSYILSDFSGRFDTLGEDLMKLSSNEHICTIYRKNEDKINSIMEFLKTGIVKNERCVIIVDKESKKDIVTEIKSLKEIRKLLNTSAIVLVDSEEVFGNKSDFNLAKTIESIESYLESPQEDNFNGIMLIIEILPLKNKNTTFNIIMELHSNIDKLISNRDSSIFCLYSEYKFESKTLLDVIITHSKLIFNGYLCQNSLFMDPYQLQLTREDKLDETIYKEAVYEIVQREISEQKRVKMDSYIKAETLRSISDSVFILDFAGKILEVNEVAYKTRGYKEEEILNLNILDIMTPVNRDLFDSRIEELKNKGEITFETTHYCKYGSALDVEFKTKIISYDDEQFILSVGRDITKRKIAEKEAKTSEEKYIRIFDNATEAVFISERDEDGKFAKIIEANNQAVKVYGYSKEELYKMKPSDFNASGLEETKGFLLRFLEEKTLRFERTHKTKEGKIIDVEISSQLFELDGKTVSLAILRDITDRKEAEEELKRSETHYRTIFETTRAANIIVDENQDVLQMNSLMVDLMGYTKEETIGKKKWTEFILQTELPKLLEYNRKRLKNPSSAPKRYETKIENRLGEIRDVLISVDIIHGTKTIIASLLDITERKKMESARKENEEKFKMIFNKANDAMYLFGIDEDHITSNFIEVNDVACKMLGYTEDEFRNMSPSDLTSKEKKKNFPEIINKLTSVKSLTFESVHFTKEGKRIPVEISSHAFLYHNKQRVLSIVRDISERKKSEEKLRRLNEELEEKVIQRTYQMETLYNIIKDISETFDLKEAMEIISKYVSQLIDYDIIVQLITQEGVNLIQIGTPKGNKEVIDDFLKIVKEEFVEINPDTSSNRDSTTIITSNEKKIQKISSHLSIPLIAEDKVVGYIVVGSEQEDAYREEEIWFLYKIADNISHTLQRLKVILAAKDELETVLNHTSDGVILINSNGAVVMTNKAGHRFLEIIKDSKTDVINNEILDLEELKQIGKKELSLKGKIYYVSISSIKTDFVHGWLLTAHDMTEERAMQKKILHQERLATLGAMTGGIAHDFNNILASIIGAADFSLMNADNIESKELLNLIIKQSERGASLIRQMLDFTRQSVIKPKPVSLLNFITEFSRVIRSSLPENIFLSVDTQDWTILIDQVQLQQLFMNLILNSRDALVHGGKIDITVEEIDNSQITDFEEIEIDTNREYIHLLIEDNGEGMNEQTKKMIFEPFFTTKAPGKGSGLGLAQVFGIVRQANGYINIESKMEVGTKVHIYIPRRSGLVEEEIVELAGRGEGRILLVEDHEDVREITKIMLENQGYVVVTAENGKNALEIYNDSFDLVLTDIVMPVMGGEKLIEKLLEINPQIKCLAMTGYSDAHVPEGVKVLNKPMTTSKLVNYIQNELIQENCQKKNFQNEKREDSG